jgi:glycosyltransferase involved in cell wall biosynthesis
LPEEPVALFVGALERSKNLDGLAEAWRRAAPRVPGARLRIVGRGSLAPVAAALVAELPEQTEWIESLDTTGVADALDAAQLLVLPSRSEGMGRVIVEALLRGRPVLATDVGGIGDLVADGDNGLLVHADDLADALVALLSDRARIERLAGRARASVDSWVATPAEYAERVREVVS